jgi:PAS domain S-box-containing protein
MNIVSTIVIFFLWAQYHKRYNGLGNLVSAFLFQMIAYVLIILRGSIPQLISVDVANSLSVLGIYLGYTGLQKYSGRITSQIPNYIFLAILAILHIVLTYIESDPTIRYFLISAAYLWFFGQCAWLLLKGVSADMLKLTRYTGYVFISFGILSAVKLIDFILSGNKPVDYFESNTLEAVVMIFYQILIIVLIISISFMFNNHLLKDIRTEEEKFATAFHTAPNAIIISTYPDCKIIEVNSGFAEITGYRPSDVIGKTTSEIEIWTDQQEKIDIVNELKSSGSVQKKECHLRKKTGNFFTGFFSAAIVILSNEKRLIISIYDITERKQLQDEIKRERNLLKTLIDNLPDAVSLKDEEGKYLLNNKAHLQVIGVESQEEVIGKTAAEFFPVEDATVYTDDDRTVLSTGKMMLDKIEYVRHSDTGSRYWHLTSRIPIKDESGKPVQMLFISHDITERKRAEDILKETDEFNRSLIKTIPFGMDVVDETGTVLFISENFRSMFGRESIGKKCWELFRDDKSQCPDCPLKKGVDIGSTNIYEAHQILGGKVFDINHTGMIFHGRKAMLEIFHDITERKRNEGELIRSKEKAEESDRLKTAFLHNISHEIRTPMNAIVGFSNLLREPGITREEHDSYTDIISRSSHHLLSIVNDVIEISNVEAGRLRLSISEVNLSNLLDDLLRQFRPKADEKRIEFRLELSGTDIVSSILTDGTKLLQIISNLLNNAFKFTDEGRISFGYTNKGQSLEFFVSDTGIGIDQDQQIRIFERFYQVDSTVTRMHEGTGIGLSISKAYVELLGGKIWLQSAPGKGSVFFFTVPVQNAKLDMSVN